MDLKGLVEPALWALGMGVAILDSRTAMAGAAEGVQLCLRTLIPGLFPLMVLSSLLSAALPRGGMLLTGILGGYPVGARNTAQVWRAGGIARADAESLAVLSNCAGPAFLFGVATGWNPALLWGVYLVSVGALWLVLPGSAMPPGLTGKPDLPEAVRGAVSAMAGVCGWVVLMRSVAAVLDRWILWLLPGWGRALVCGLLELTNGILALEGLDSGLGFVLAAGMVGFGGVCVMMQTFGVTRGLSMKLYFPGKVFQGCVCACLGAVITGTAMPWQVWGLLVLCGGGCAVFLRKSKNNCGNLQAVGV